MCRHSHPQNTRRLDHLSIVAGVINTIRLVEVIDRLILPAPQRIVSYGNAVKTMIINALRFVSRPLCMHPQFFDGKPVEHLFLSHTATSNLESSATILDLPKAGEEKPRILRTEHFNDASLGGALDDLFEAGTSTVSLFHHFYHYFPPFSGNLGGQGIKRFSKSATSCPKSPVSKCLNQNSLGTRKSGAWLFIKSFRTFVLSGESSMALHRRVCPILFPA